MSVTGSPGAGAGSGLWGVEASLEPARAPIIEASRDSLLAVLTALADFPGLYLVWYSAIW